MSQLDGSDYGALVEALKSLQAKREPIQGRLHAIEERRGTTAPHIYEKVRRETAEKLEGIESEAASYQEQARTALARITEQKAEITEQLARINEEIEELRFRNSLGEFGADEFQGLESAKQAELHAIEGRVPPLIEIEALLDRFLQSAAQPEPLPTADSVPPAAAPQPAPAPARPPVSEMEALFGSGGFPAQSRAGVSKTDPTVIPPGDGEEPARGFDRRTTSAYQPLGDGTSTDDFGLRAAPAKVKPAFPQPAASGAPRPVLIVKTRDKDRGEDTYDLQSGQTLIGRAPENDIILLEESVSRRHARILVEGLECTIEDLGSANGSYVNGERLRPKQPRKLQDNDVVKLGQLLALFRMNPED